MLQFQSITSRGFFRRRGTQPSTHLGVSRHNHVHPPIHEPINTPTHYSVTDRRRTGAPVFRGVPSSEVRAHVVELVQESQQEEVNDGSPS